MWPSESAAQTGHNYVEARISFMTTRRPSTVAGNAVVGRGDLAYRSGCAGGETWLRARDRAFGAAQTRRVRDSPVEDVGVVRRGGVFQDAHLTLFSRKRRKFLGN